MYLEKGKQIYGGEDYNLYSNTIDVVNKFVN